MALPLPKGKQITVAYREISSDYEMPSMEVASDHYSLGFMIKGDRRIITPKMNFSLHAGFVGAMRPFVYHRTIPASSSDYVSILIKFSPDFVADMTESIGSQIMEKIFKYPPISFSDADRIKIFQMAQDIYEMYNAIEKNGLDMSEGSISRYRLQNLLTYILLEIYEKGHFDSTKATIHESELTGPIMEAVYYIEKNYMKPLKIDEVAAVSGYSVSYFSRIFAKQLGSDFTDYLCITRLKHVQNLLLTTNKSVMDISLECGFSYPGNMTSSFKKEFGMTPLHFRKQNQRSN
ncbi:MAG: helix-turn-helix transcriptional regulator [Butyrivibrio sp.]|uniref:helix-turn-helix domain-containing protein n=1 Tax=Butyrivibrio sp. TaxID=28121 RepID=UPI001B07B19A|nr:AraC family transcriptional regulator [Butyrivibrio sp.]MBO6242403.1 helix-turn-helix transcriptional regulator [Butyrivibrio sp.]